MTDAHPRDPDQREWISVTPAHKSAGRAATPVGSDGPSASTRTSNALAITAMGLGLIALLTAIVSLLYFTNGLWLSAVIGLIAAALGGSAIRHRCTQRPAALTGLTTGLLAIAASLITGVLVLTGAVAPSDGLGTATLEAEGNPSTGGANDPSGGGEAPSGARSAAEWGADQTTLLEWPANMATGGILFAGDMQPVHSDPLGTRDTITPAPISRETGPADIRLYVDYRCPSCMAFEQEHGAQLEALVRSGAATLEIVPLTFLDRASQGTAYSSRAAGAMACVVDAQPEAAWSAHTALLSPAVQPREGSSGLSNDEIVSALETATGGLLPGVRDCIETGRFVQFASAFGTWAGSNPVPNAIDPQLTVAGTPFVVVNGVPYAGSPDDRAAFAQFLAHQGL